MERRTAEVGEAAHKETASTLLVRDAPQNTYFAWHWELVVCWRKLFTLLPFVCILNSCGNPLLLVPGFLDSVRSIVFFDLSICLDSWRSLFHPVKGRRFQGRARIWLGKVMAAR